MERNPYGFMSSYIFTIEKETNHKNVKTQDVTVDRREFYVTTLNFSTIYESNL